MSAQDLFDALSTFFNDVPEAVRIEMSILLVTLAGDGAIGPDDQIDYEQAARVLFDGETQFARIGNLIGAAAMIDVYFAEDPRSRFASVLKQCEQRHAGAGRNSLNLVRERYADRLAAIERSRRAWATLRRTVLAPASISAALTPPFNPDARPSDAGRLAPR